jgi:hypothetical protein
MDDDFVGKIINTKKNGAILPEYIYRTNSKIKFDRNFLIKLLEKDETLEKFDDADEDMAIYRALDESIRKDTLIYFGYHPDSDDSFKAYQLACGRFINDEEIRNKVVWMKFDKTRLGDLKIGDDVITKGIYLYHISGKRFSFEELLCPDKINIVISGSIS